MESHLEMNTPAIKITTLNSSVGESMWHSHAHLQWWHQDTHIGGPVHSNFVGSEDLGDLGAMLHSNTEFPFHWAASPLSVPWFQIQFYLGHAVWPWENHLTSLSLSFFIYKMEVKITSFEPFLCARPCADIYMSYFNDLHNIQKTYVDLLLPFCRHEKWGSEGKVTCQQLYSYWVTVGIWT